jgi:hypothetical protein
MNGDHLLDGNPTLREILRANSEPTKILDELCLATLSRLPTETERALLTKLASESKDREMGWRAVQWVLLNGSEFVLIH